MAESKFSAPGSKCKWPQMSTMKGVFQMSVNHNTVMTQRKKDTSVLLPTLFDLGDLWEMLSKNTPQ